MLSIIINVPNRMEEMWFGEPIYIFDDNWFWIEKNFTIGNEVALLEESV